MTEAKVVVVVVNWNGLQYLEGCLGSLARQTFGDREVILVDNGSVDGSVEFVQREFPEVRILRNPGNVGFAAANNQAIIASMSDYVALLNNDAHADPDWLRHLVATAEWDHSIGACASQMLFWQAPTVINSTGIAVDRAGIAWDRWGGMPAEETSDEPGEVFGACAGAALYRRSLFEDVGGFDEDFFAYLEDVDLAWRARLRGWRCLYTPRARVLHRHSGTGKEGSPFKNYLLGRNKLWTIIKNYPMPALARYLPAIALYDIGSTQYSALLRGDWSPARGRLAAMGGLGKMLRKRREVQAKRLVSFSELAKVMEPLVRPDKIPQRYRHLESIGSR